MINNKKVLSGIGVLALSAIAVTPIVSADSGLNNETGFAVQSVNTEFENTAIRGNLASGNPITPPGPGVVSLPEVTHCDVSPEGGLFIYIAHDHELVESDAPSGGFAIFESLGVTDLHGAEKVLHYSFLEEDVTNPRAGVISFNLLNERYHHHVIVSFNSGFGGTCGIESIHIEDYEG